MDTISRRMSKLQSQQPDIATMNVEQSAVISDPNETTTELSARGKRRRSDVNYAELDKELNASL